MGTAGCQRQMSKTTFIRDSVTNKTFSPSKLPFGTFHIQFDVETLWTHGSLVIFGTLEIIGGTRANGINDASRIIKKFENNWKLHNLSEAKCDVLNGLEL